MADRAGRPGPRMEMCPLLSTPASLDGRGRKMPAAMQPCIGTDCMLYRDATGECSLYEIPNIQKLIRSVGGKATESLDALNAAAEGVDTRTRKTLEEWEETSTGIFKLYEALRRDLAGETVKAGEERERLSGMLGKFQSEIAAAVAALDEEVRRIRESDRLAAAEAAGLEATREILRGNLTEAASKLDQAVRETQRTPRLLNALGCAYFRQGNLPDAERTLRECLEVDPGHASAWVNLALVLARGGRADDAEKVVREGLRLSPGSAAGWNTLGNLLFTRGRRGEAVDAWFKAVESDPGLVPAWENLRRQQLLDNCPFEVLLDQAPAGVVPPPPVPKSAPEESISEPPSEPPSGPPSGGGEPPPDAPSPETPPPVVEPMVTMEVSEDIEPTMYEEESSSVELDPPSDSSDEETLEGSASFDEMEELTLEGEPPPPE